MSNISPRDKARKKNIITWTLIGVALGLIVETLAINTTGASLSLLILIPVTIAILIVPMVHYINSDIGSGSDNIEIHMNVKEQMTNETDPNRKKQNA